ncbi:MAG: hypothetical protein H0V96_09130 [Acidimicrobiia bacterium]|nr:hypothetical protein [Acidimicrobiia bacterium]
MATVTTINEVLDGHVSFDLNAPIAQQDSTQPHELLSQIRGRRPQEI